MEIPDEQVGEIVRLCKEKVETDFSCRVGFFIKEITKRKETESLCEKISAQIINDKKYNRKQNNGFDYYVFKAPKKDWKDKYWWVVLFIGFAIGFLFDIAKEVLTRKSGPATDQSQPTIQPTIDTLK